MTWGEGAVLGTLQGLTEFLPVSSSAHLTLAPWLLGWRDPGLAFDTALHLGTLAALLAYFWRDWLRLLLGARRDLRSPEGRLLLLLALASLPGGLAGLFLAPYAEGPFRDPPVVAAALIVFALWLEWADLRGEKRLGLEGVDLRRALLIGASQALAVVPGVSRSGITITAGLLEGLSNEAAVRFSFLLATPIVLGAGLHQLPRLRPEELGSPFAAGLLASGLTGLAAIHLLLGWVRRSGFRPFTVYRVALGALTLGLHLAR